MEDDVERSLGCRKMCREGSRDLLRGEDGGEDGVVVVR